MPPRGSDDTPEALIEQMRVHALEIMLAPDLVDLVGTGSDQDLLARVRGLRRKIAMELGIVVPPVRTRDSVDLPRSTYVVRIAGVEVGRGEAPAGRLLALGDHLEGLGGTAVVEPVFGLPGKWIPAELRHSAEMLGATVVDRVSVLITHLGAIIDANAPRLLSREDVRVLTEGVKAVNPSVVDELVPGLLTLGEVQRVLQGLLAERVPVRDLSRIYEALTLRAKVSTDPEGLVEAARGGLGPALAAPYASDGVLRVITLDPMLEQSLAEHVRPGRRRLPAAARPGACRADARVDAADGRPGRGLRQDGRPGVCSRPAARAAPYGCPVTPRAPGAVLRRGDGGRAADRDGGCGDRCPRDCCLTVRTCAPSCCACATRWAPTPGSCAPSACAPAGSRGSSPRSTTS